MLIIITAFGQKQLLKKYDFDQGGYTLLGVHPNGFFPEDKPDESSKLADSLGEFYTDDIGVLNLFKKNWVFKKGLHRN